MMRNLTLALSIIGLLVVASCKQRPTEDARSTPIDVAVTEEQLAAPQDATNTNLDTIPKDNTDVATTSGRTTPPSR